MRHSSIAAAARAMRDRGGWIVLEACVDVPAQAWEARVVIFSTAPETIAEAVEEEIAYEPGLDLRLTGCCRQTLAPDPEMGTYLCYLAPPAAAGVPM